MNGFALHESILDNADYRGLSDRAARLLLRASFHCQARNLDRLNDKAIRGLQAKPSDAYELVTAGYWAVEGDCYVGAAELDTPRVRAARLAGQASARARAERHGTAQPRKSERSSNGAERSPEPSSNGAPNVPERPPERSRTIPRTQLEPNAERSRTDATDPPSPSQTLPLPATLSFSDLSSLLASLQGPVSKRGRARKEHSPRQTWKRVPAEWEPNAQHAQIATERRVDYALELAKFRDHEFATPKRDPDATFRNWLRAARPPIGMAPPPLALPPRKHATLADVQRMMGLG